MDTKELMMTTCTSVQQFSVCLWDYNTTSSIRCYKNGGCATQNGLSILGKDYIITTDAEKPVLYAWLVNSLVPVKLVLPKRANCIAVSPYSDYLAAGIECKLYVWHISSGKLLTVQQKHYQPISVIKFSNDGIYLCVGGQDATLITYWLPGLLGCREIESGQSEPLYSKTDHSAGILDLFIGNFGGRSRVATISTDGRLIIYKLASGEWLETIEFVEEPTAVVFDNPGRKIFVGTNLGSLYEIDLSEDLSNPLNKIDKTWHKKFTGHNCAVTCLALNSDNTVLASGSKDCTVCTWKLENRRNLKTIDHKGIITNILFVNNNSNFSMQSFEPEVFIGKLDKELNANQNYDIIQYNQYLEVDEYNLEEKIKNIMKETINLRASNSQLYNMVVTTKKLKKS